MQEGTEKLSGHSWTSWPLWPSGNSLLLKKRLKEKLRQPSCHEIAEVSKESNGDAGENETLPVDRCFQTVQWYKKNAFYTP